MGAIVGYLIKQYKYLSWATSAGGAVFILFGVAGTIVHSILADKYQ
jgi:hypothetical protein